MKKYYHSQEWKRYTSKRSHDAIQIIKKKKRARKKWQGKSPVSPKYPNIRKAKDRIELIAPDNFSLLNNIDETLLYFSQLDAAIARQYNVFLDLSKVRQITSEVILYMLSRIEYNRSHYDGGTINIAGNAPADADCKRIFVTSGFLDYVFTRRPKKLNSDPTVYSIQSDFKVLGDKAKEVTDFAKRSTGTLADGKKIVYPILIECMGNTNNHAYTDSSNYRHWWLMASYHRESNKVRFSFVDNGQGIPYTIKRDFKEHVSQLSHKFMGSLLPKDFRIKDSILIESALKGELRTRTKKSHRGNGLPWIYNNAQRNYIDDLVIISKKGFVDCSKSVSRDLDGVLHGTLLSWNFVSAKGGLNNGNTNQH